MTMILDLPVDLVMEIFHRVPLKYMREVRLTCKKLNILSQSESFSKMHLAKEVASREEGEHQRVVIVDDTLSLMRVVFDGDPSTEPKVKLIGLTQQVKISQVFHCEGLLLCTLKDDRRVVVWNPYWGQTRWIEPRHTQRLSSPFSYYGYSLGYANERNSCQRRYKLLRSVDDQFHAPGEGFPWYEIYDFDSDQWITLDDPQGWHIWGSDHNGVSFKGNTYFCATKVTLVEDAAELEGHLICFDYQRESFGPLMRMPFRSYGHGFVTLSCVSEEKLALLLTHDKSNLYEVEIWITTKIEPGEISWSKFLTLSTEPYKPWDLSVFFIDEGKKVAMGFDEDYDSDRYSFILSIFGEAGYLKRLKLVEKSHDSNNIIRNTQVCSYVPSLVKLKQPARGPRKQQSDSEQRRYDEKMSRLV